MGREEHPLEPLPATAACDEVEGERRAPNDVRRFKGRCVASEGKGEMQRICEGKGP